MRAHLLSRTSADNIPAMLVELAGKGVGIPERFEKGSRRQGELKSTAPNVIADVKHSLAELKARRIGGIENGIKITCRHSTPRGRTTTERVESAEVKLNGRCTPVLIRDGIKQCKSRRYDWLDSHWVRVA